MKHLDIILKKMCWFVRADYSSIDFMEKNWFMKHGWDEIDQYLFSQWMKIYLLYHKDAHIELFKRELKTKKEVQKGIDMFILSYGWKGNLNDKTGDWL